MTDLKLRECPFCGGKAELFHLCVWNRKDMYAFCPKTNIAFLPFEQDTRTFFCGFGERKDGGNADENRDPEN